MTYRIENAWSPEPAPAGTLTITLHNLSDEPLAGFTLSYTAITRVMPDAPAAGERDLPAPRRQLPPLRPARGPHHPARRQLDLPRSPASTARPSTAATASRPPTSPSPTARHVDCRGRRPRARLRPPGGAARPPARRPPRRSPSRSSPGPPASSSRPATPPLALIPGRSHRRPRTLPPSPPPAPCTAASSPPPAPPSRSRPVAGGRPVAFAADAEPRARRLPARPSPRRSASTAPTPTAAATASPRSSTSCTAPPPSPRPSASPRPAPSRTPRATTGAAATSTSPATSGRPRTSAASSTSSPGTG